MSQITVSFSGLAAHSGPLSFGHANIVRAITVDEDPTRLSLAMVFDAPAAPDADSGLGRITAQLRTLVERHEALRTTYPQATPPVQQVAGEGLLTVELVDTAGDPLEAAERTARRLRSRPFALDTELPFRAAVVTVDGVPRHLVWVVTHAAMDVAACETLHAEWAALSAGRELPAAGMQPVEVVALEQSPTISRLGEGALRYWRAQMERVPQAMFTTPHDAPAKTSWLHAGLAIRSSTVPDHLRAVAERTGSSPSAVALAALVTLIAHRTGHRTVVTTSLSGNRVVRALRGFFGSLAQDALLPVAFDGTPDGAAGTGAGPAPADTGAGALESFDDVVRRVRSAALPAYRSSWFDPTAVWQVINGVSGERGISFARDLVFNDMSALATAAGSPDQSALGRLPAVWIPGHQPPPEEGPDLGGSLTWLPAEDIPCRFFACLYRMDEEFELTLWVDPQTLDKDEAEAFGRSLLHLLRAAAEKDVPLADVPGLGGPAPVARGEGWLLSDRSWIETAAVRDLMAEVMGDAPHLVVAEPDEHLGHRLVCHLTVPASPEAVHERTLLALPGRVTAMAPHHYIVHPTAPEAGPAGIAAWAALPVTAASSGRPQGRDHA
ncbi:condensation domain-containing protein [Streptomyces sp. TBY4]|uniref:condensation domain-containing protein n=1 Tax=Streptomyces sp. TBY4 TaxID=2962030 RepID=UPI00265FE706|nr:condensation domain-containing protein [Streptomyces sp. TBY4]